MMISIFTFSIFHSCLVFHISLLIRYATCSTYFDEFGYHDKLLVNRLLSQGYEVNRLRNSLQKCYGRYLDLIAKYLKLIRDMLNDSLHFVDFHDLQDFQLECHFDTIVAVCTHA